jgi:hypothetical protein
METLTKRFYTYSQNNSGGGFKNSESNGISEYVIIEASSADHANKRAEEIGLYFDGCEDGRDCSCCGDRWSKADEYDGYEVPSLYGDPIENIKKSYFRKDYFIHYLDGTFEKKELLNEKLDG